VALPPGDYSLAVERADFAKYQEDAIRVAVQGNIERTVTLHLLESRNQSLSKGGPR
jgi:hypothetical protein